MKKVVVIILVIIIAVLAVLYYGDFRNKIYGNSTNQEPLVINGVLLPPDPGKAGKKTIEGIDSDNDGVRDDIQRYIALTYPESEKTRAGLSLFAKLNMAALLVVDDKETSIAATHASFIANECLGYIHGTTLAYDLMDELFAEVLNTRERIRAYTKAGRNFSGQSSIIPPVDDKSACDFDPDAMAN